MVTISVIWGLVSKYAGSAMRFNYLHRKHIQKAINFTPGCSKTVKIILTQVLWPLNTYNTLRCGIPAIREAKEENE